MADMPEARFSDDFSGGRGFSDFDYSEARRVANMKGQARAMPEPYDQLTDRVMRLTDAMESDD